MGNQGAASGMTWWHVRTKCLPMGVCRNAAKRSLLGVFMMTLMFLAVCLLLSSSIPSMAAFPFSDCYHVEGLPCKPCEDARAIWDMSKNISHSHAQPWRHVWLTTCHVCQHILDK